ncbi:MAG: intradiol ring-cleavage dioxygenase [Methylobacteriaceae bacterium]|nr:intradiol ring-cleavage dioxygenase [Methylobacteriaceae bacterium]
MNLANQPFSRRGVLTAGACSVAGLILTNDAASAQQGLAPTPACHDHDEPTLAETEGPYFRPRSPQRSDLREPGIAGQPVELSGYVLTHACMRIAGALVDLWHADSSGDYDNTGFRLRGHVFTDNEGRFLFRTILPGIYPGRTRHYHVKIQAPGASRVLTTQFYFPNEKRNRSDGLFRRELLMQTAEAGDTLMARFDVVL